MLSPDASCVHAAAQGGKLMNSGVVRLVAAAAGIVLVLFIRLVLGG